MRPAQRKLLALVEKIFADGVVTQEERSELVSLYAGAGLTVSEVKAVFASFVDETWSAAKADCVVTADELERVRIIVRELRLPPGCLPREIAAALRRAA